MPHQPSHGLPMPRLISSDCRILLDAAPDAMLVVNREGEIIVANPAAERLFGRFGDEFTGRIVESLLPERFREQHKLDRAIFASDPRARPMGAGLELFALRSDASEVPVDISLKHRSGRRPSEPRPESRRPGSRLRRRSRGMRARIYVWVWVRLAG